MLGSDEVEIVKVVLEGSCWVWVGDGFVNVLEVVFIGFFYLVLFFWIIFVDFVVFKEFLFELGVREMLILNEFVFVFLNMVKDK